MEPKILERINTWLTPTFDEDTQTTIKNNCVLFVFLMKHTQHNVNKHVFNQTLLTRLATA